MKEKRRKVKKKVAEYKSSVSQDLEGGAVEGVTCQPARQQQWPVTGSQPSVALQSQRSLQFSPNVPSCGDRNSEIQTPKVLTLPWGSQSNKTELLPNKDAEKLGPGQSEGLFL